MINLVSNIIQAFSGGVKKHEKIVLVGDIGGTNIRLMLINFNVKMEGFTELKYHNYKGKYLTPIKGLSPGEEKKIIQLEDAIKDFLEDLPISQFPSGCYLGMAGVVINNKINMANREYWPLIDGTSYCSYSIVRTDHKEFIQLNDAPQLPWRPMVVCGVGTGLGLTFVIPKNIDGQVYYHSYATEYGHSGFPQITEEQKEFYIYLKEVYPLKGEHIPVEYVFAGPALVHIYNFLKQKYKKIDRKINIEDELGSSNFEKIDESFPRKEVFQYGFQKRDALCTLVVKFFIEIYSNVIGDICMTYLPYGGIYLCGGITNSIKQYLLENKSLFMKDYIGKRMYIKDIFDSIPIYIVDGEVGLKAGYYVAKEKHIKEV